MSTKGYNTYRGRSPFKRFLKILAVILLVLAVLAVAAVIYLQQFLVYSDDGVRLVLPFLQGEPAPTVTPPPPAGATEPVVVLSPEPTPTPEPARPGTVPVALPPEAISDGTAAARVDAGGGDCALFDMKGDDGKLGYRSDLEQGAVVSSDTPGINEAIRALNETEGLYTIARVSCFKDGAILDYYQDFAILTNSGYHWTDPEGIRWISPASAGVREYLTGICVELARLGFDEILLDNAGYPDRGNLGWIRPGEAYDKAQLPTVVGGFYQQVAAALAQYGTTLSVVTTEGALAGTDALTGQTPDSLGGADRLWVRSEAGGLLPAALPQPSGGEE